MLPSADPTANPEPTQPSGKLQETWDSLDGFELGVLPSWNGRVHVFGSSFSDGLHHFWKTLPYNQHGLPCGPALFSAARFPEPLAYCLGLIPVPFTDPIFLGELTLLGAFLAP